MTLKQFPAKKTKNSILQKKTPTQTKEQKLREKDANMEAKIILEKRDKTFLLHTNRFVARSTRKKPLTKKYFTYREVLTPNCLLLVCNLVIRITDTQIADFSE